ncbi:hypothetical protein RvY_05873 [Ramazzottius varieornatus]|uniref:Uncharacterized protein n=1 Tax=Ramazzottius varieornatus TaxID=947166 RepID=A0A1D1V044_RAMVA|nr:hypothetical protein RvY_05873 [Ramazzottius varieornatus]
MTIKGRLRQLAVLAGYVQVVAPFSSSSLQLGFWINKITALLSWLQPAGAGLGPLFVRVSMQPAEGVVYCLNGRRYSALKVIVIYEAVDLASALARGMPEMLYHDQSDTRTEAIILNVFALDKYIAAVCSCCPKVHHRDSSLPFPSFFNSAQIYKCLRSDTVIKINKNYRINGAPVEPHDLEYINSIIDMYNRRLQLCLELHDGDYIGLKHPGSFTQD